VAVVEVIRANGLEIAYERAGAGPPLVLVHGAGDDSRVWQPQLAALADEFTVVAWDEPGAGSSSDLPVVFGIAEYAHCLGALIEALALGPAHIAGLSWGGTVAQELYRQHPRLVATLILADTYAGWTGDLGRARRSFAPGRRPSVRAGDRRYRADRDPALRSRQQPRPARVLQRGRKGVLPGPFGALLTHPGAVKRRSSRDYGCCRLG
jgi:pimeloyl-ACP methyl ester carboxylesterase